MSTPLKFRTALLRSARLISEQVNQLLLPHQLNYSLWQVLYVIQEKQCCTSVEVAQYLNISKPAIAKRMAILHQLNLLCHLDSQDKREKKVSLSAIGYDLFQRCAAEIDALEHALLLDLDAEQLKQSLDVLQTLVQRLEAPQQGGKDV